MLGFASLLRVRMCARKYVGSSARTDVSGLDPLGLLGCLWYLAQNARGNMLGRDQRRLAVEARHKSPLASGSGPGPSLTVTRGQLRAVRNRSVASSCEALVGELAAGSRHIVTVLSCPRKVSLTAYRANSLPAFSQVLSCSLWADILET